MCFYCSACCVRIICGELMRISLGKVEGHVLKDGGYRFTAENGTLDVIPVVNGIVLFEYNVNGYTVPRFLNDSSDSLFSLKKQAIKSAISDVSDGWVITFGDTTVQATPLPKATAAMTTVLRLWPHCSSAWRTTATAWWSSWPATPMR